MDASLRWQDGIGSGVKRFPSPPRTPTCAPMKIDGFLLGMFGAVMLALLAPGLGAANGPLHLGLVTAIGIGFVFFLHGAALAPAALRAGAANWRLHLLVHGSTFVLFPAIGFLLFRLAEPVASLEVRTGVFYLCALPSTISSSVAMTALGRGNVAGAIFDATLSGLIGMVVTPALVALVVDAHGNMPLLPAMLDIARTLLLPFVLGQIARRWIGGFIAANKAWTSRIDRLVILLIVYGAFCESTAAGVWTRTDPLVLGGVLVTVLLLLFAILALTRLAARLVGLSLPDEVAAVFCGSKKSLANGAPMAAILFGQSPSLGLIMLPVMLYHQAQLFVCTLLARRYAARVAAAELSRG